MTQIDTEAAVNEHSLNSGWSYMRLLSVAPFGAVLALFLLYGTYPYPSLDKLHEHHRELEAFVRAEPSLAVLLFVLSYATMIAMSVPGAAVMTLASGFLFGIWQGTAAVVIGATTGATVLFLIARSAFGRFLRPRTGPWLARMEAGFNKNALIYLLALRLIPAVPFAIVNLASAVLGVRLSVFVLGTFLGIIPGTFMFTSIGAGLGSAFALSEE